MRHSSITTIGYAIGTVLVLAMVIPFNGCQDQSSQVEVAPGHYVDRALLKSMTEPVKERRSQSLQQEVRTGRYAGKVRASGTAPSCANVRSPLAVSTESLIDPMTLHHLHQYTFELYPTMEEGRCIRATMFLDALEQVASAVNPRSSSLSEQRDVLQDVYRAGGGMAYLDVDWRMVRYHTFRELMRDYLSVCNTTFESRFEHAVGKENVHTDMVKLWCDRDDDHLCRSVKARIDKTLGEQLYPGLSNPLISAQKLFELHQKDVLTAADQAALRIYDKIVSRHVNDIGMYKTFDENGEPLREPFLDFADRFMPYTDGSWSDWFNLIFSAGLCSPAISEARRQQSWDLWLSRHKARPVEELSQAQEYGDLPGTLSAFCDQKEPIVETTIDPVIGGQIKPE